MTAYEAVKGGGLKWPPLSREQCAAQYLVAIEDVRRAKARGDFEAAIQAADRRGEYRARLEHIDSQAESGRQKNGRDPVKLAQADEFKALVIRRWLELKDSPPNPKLGWGNRRNINNTAKEICKELREHPRIAGYSNPVDSVRKIIKAFEAKIGK